MRIHARGACLLLAGLALARPAAAQKPHPLVLGASDTLPTPELTFAATRYATTLAEAPAQVAVVTRAEIQRYGYRTLAEIVGSVTGGMQLNDRNYSFVGLRGFIDLSDFNTRYLLLLDGHRLNGATDGSFYAGGADVISVDDIERVEIVRGPGSTMFGTNAFFGIINVLTRRGRDLGGVEVRSSGAGAGTWQGGAAFGRGEPDGLQIYASAAAYRSAGQHQMYFEEFDDPSTNDGIAEDLDGERWQRAYVRVTDGDLYVQGFASSRAKDIPNAPYDVTFNDPRTRTIDRKFGVMAGWERVFDDLSRAWASVSWDASSYDGDYPYDGELYRDWVRANGATVEGQYLKLFAAGHKLGVGGETRWNPSLRSGGMVDEPRDTVFDVEEDDWVAAAFAQGEIRLGSRSYLLLGVRHDHYATVGGSTNPRGALVIGLGRSTTLKWTAGSAFRAPSVYELYYEDGGLTQKAASELGNEKTRSLEVGIDWDVSAFTRFTLSTYDVLSRDLILLREDPDDGLLVFANGERIASRGVEGEVRTRTASGLEARLGLALQDVKVGEEARRPVNGPRFIARAAASTPLLSDRARLSTSASWMGERTRFDGGSVPATIVTDATLLASLPGLRNALLTVSLYDIFDERRSFAGGEQHQQAILRDSGRTLRVGLLMGF